MYIKVCTPSLGLLIAAFFTFQVPISEAQKTLADSTVLPTLIIQATRAGADHPVPHNNISAAKLAEQGMVQDIPYLLSSIPSLVESSDAGAGVGYTGMRIRGSDPTRINVTINGVPLNDGESQGLYWVDLPDLAASASEIQVQRGVGTSTNGGGAFGASVNLDLSGQVSDPFTRLSSSVGSFNTRKHSFYSGTGLMRGKLAFSGRFSLIQSDGYIDRAAANLKGMHLNGSYVDEHQSLVFNILSGREITYQAWYGVPAQYIKDPSLRRYNAAGTERAGAPYDNEVDDYTQSHFLLHYKRQLAPNLFLQLNGHYTRGFGYYEQYKADQSFSDYGFPELLLGDTLITGSDLIRRRWLDNDFYGFTYALNWEPSNISKVSLGGALNQYKGAHFGEVIWSAIATAPKDSRYYDNNAQKTDGNVYLQYTIQWPQNCHSFIDLQYRQLAYQFLGINKDLEAVDQTVHLGFFNPKVGLSWDFKPKWRYHIYAGIANREPNRDDYTQSTPNSRPKPERLYDLESGLRFGQTKASIGLNFFYMTYKDQLVLDGRINDVGAYIRTNVPKSYRSGIELEARWLPFSFLDLDGNLALSHNKIPEYTEYIDNWDTGGQDIVVHQNTDLAFSPAVIARLATTFKLLPNSGKHSLGLTCSGKYVSRQYLDNSSSKIASLDAYFVNDLRINYGIKNIVGEKISFVFQMNNLFNAQYSANGWNYRYVSALYDDRPYNPYTRLESGSTYNQTGFFPQAGRNWLLTAEIAF